MVTRAQPSFQQFLSSYKPQPASLLEKPFLGKLPHQTERTHDGNTRCLD